MKCKNCSSNEQLECLFNQFSDSVSIKCPYCGFSKTFLLSAYLYQCPCCNYPNCGHNHN